MNNPKKEADPNLIEIAEPYRGILAKLIEFENEGSAMEERIQASLAIARGQLAGQLKNALIGAITTQAGKTPGPCALASDLTHLKLTQPSAAGPQAVPQPVKEG